jgi:hypothetical protein
LAPAFAIFIDFYFLGAISSFLPIDYILPFISHRRLHLLRSFLPCHPTHDCSCRAAQVLLCSRLSARRVAAGETRTNSACTPQLRRHERTWLLMQVVTVLLFISLR